MVSKLQKFNLLLWKNWLLQKQKLKQTIFEILFSVIFCILLIVIRAVVDHNVISDPTIYDSFKIDKFPKIMSPSSTIGFGKKCIAYTPNDSIAKDIMELVAKSYLNICLKGFDTEDSMVSYLTESGVLAGQTHAQAFEKFSSSGNSSFLNSGNGSITLDFLNAEKEQRFPKFKEFIGGVVFSNLNAKLKYKIRLTGTPETDKKIGESPSSWYTEYIFVPMQLPGPRQRKDKEGGKPDLVEIKMERMPFPPFIDDLFVVILEPWLPLIILVSYLYPAINIVKSILQEKESRLKESMKIMGMENWLHWAAWLVRSITMLTCTSFLITLLLCIRFGAKGATLADNSFLGILNKSSPTLIFFLLFLYSCNVITWCFFLTTLFSKANTGATATGVIWFFSYLPMAYIQPQFLSLTNSFKTGISIYFNIAMTMAFYLIALFEGAGVGAQWSTLWSGISPQSSFSLAHVLLMLFFDCIFYGVLTWYIEAVFPGEFGVPRSWNFPFTREYWFGYEIVSAVHKVEIFENSEKFEVVTNKNANVGIKIRGLTKIFNGKPAVKNMHLDMYENEITVLLGHNGAGKSTTMSMLTGLFPPTSGTAQVCGYDIIKNINRVRESIGICPQHNVLFDDLTVREHIQFFTQLKGLDVDKISDQVSDILKAVKLTNKIDQQAHTLSGGMKRKLSVAIALCAGSKVVILDEPTSGMDPNARRSIWELLQKEKNNRTILLTTHYMEEADLLGDRIAIMSGGVVQCCGSSMFLKKLFGTGYQLTIVKEEGCETRKIFNVIKAHAPNARIQQNVAAELNFLLPNDEVKHFSELFTDLERNKSQLKISSFGASETTLEEVFLKVGQEQSTSLEDTTDSLRSSSEDVDQLETAQNADQSDTSAQNIAQLNTWTQNIDPLETSTQNIYQSKAQKRFFDQSQTIFFGKSVENRRNTSIKLLIQQFRALMVKRALYTYRNWLLTLTQTIMPVVFLILNLVVIKNLPGVSDFSPELVMDLADYKGTKILVQNQGTSNLSLKFLESYKKQFSYPNEAVWIGPDVNLTEFLLQQAVYDLPTYNQHWIAGVKIEDVAVHDFNQLETFKQNFNQSKMFEESLKIKVTVLFNNQPFHTLPLALNLANKAVINAFRNRSLETYNSNERKINSDDWNSNSINDILRIINFKNSNTDEYESYNNSTDKGSLFIDSYNSNEKILALLNFPVSLLVSNHPLPRKNSEKLSQSSSQTVGVQIAFNLAFGFSFLAASFVIFVIKEKESNIKHLQFVSGVNGFIYWFTMALWDVLCTVPSFVLVLVCLHVYGEEHLCELAQLCRIFLVLLFYLWAILPFMYLSSYYLDQPTSGFTRMSIAHVLFGTGSFIIVSILQTPQLMVKEVGDILDWICLLFPPYAMAGGIRDLYLNSKFTQICESQIAKLICIFLPFKPFPCCFERGNCGENGCIFWNPRLLGFKSLGIGRMLLFMGIEGLVFYFIIAGIENGIFNRLKSKFLTLFRSVSNESSKKSRFNSAVLDIGISMVNFGDEDVYKEKIRIKNGDLSDILQTDKLLLKDLSKIYKNGVVAVDKLNLGVPQGECFGLLGVNGAGKTSIFKMLTGDLSITDGEAYVNGYSVKSNIKKVQQQIGYCPQFDALLEKLTGRETLRLFARLRGLPERWIDTEINAITEQLLITKHIDKLVGALSGGNKRKVSTAIALLGNPPLLLLDEPTSGMDPAARRHLWGVLNSVRDSGTSIILTSHSMDECEALCTRLAIMTNGSFRCLGSLQHLKSKFAEGFSVIIKVKTTNEGENKKIDFSETSLYQCSDVKNDFEFSVESIAAVAPVIKFPTSLDSTSDIELNSLSSPYTGFQKDEKDASTVLFRSVSYPHGVVNVGFENEEDELSFSRDMERVNNFMLNTFAKSYLREMQWSRLEYFIPVGSTSWGQVFGVLERIKGPLNIDDYSVTQTTLERVFLNFTSAQRRASEA